MEFLVDNRRVNEIDIPFAAAALIVENNFTAAFGQLFRQLSGV